MAHFSANADPLDIAGLMLRHLKVMHSLSGPFNFLLQYICNQSCISGVQAMIQSLTVWQISVNKRKDYTLWALCQGG